jgi:hypothetical protein
MCRAVYIISEGDEPTDHCSSDGYEVPVYRFPQSPILLAYPAEHPYDEDDSVFDEENSASRQEIQDYYFGEYDTGPGDDEEVIDLGNPATAYSNLVGDEEDGSPVFTFPTSAENA